MVVIKELLVWGKRFLFNYVRFDPKLEFTNSIFVLPHCCPFGENKTYNPNRNGILIVIKMSFKTEMDNFFARNCYSEVEREAVKGSLSYQLAAASDDTIEAQEIATKIQEFSVRAAV
jgi:hypothetical protein